MASPSHLNGHYTTSPRRWRMVLTCVSIVLNAATAGGIFTFPLLSPGLSSRLCLTQPQLTTIVLAGMIGQYPLSPIIGSIIDKRGPWISSLMSAVLFSVGFGLFSLEVRHTPVSITHASSASFYRLVVFFFLAGLGTVTSYFSALFAASKNFPKYSGIASGSSMAIFGLSPLILSLFASLIFTDSQEDLDIAGFTTFLATLTGVVNAIGAIALHIELPPAEQVCVAPTAEEPSRDRETHSETTPLLNHKTMVPHYDKTWDVISDYNFWVLALVALLTLGSCEMVIANIGTISLALPARSVTNGFSVNPNISSVAEVSTAATQVRLLSLSNTFSRLIGGSVADYMSPVAAYLPSGILALPRQHKVSRVAFLWVPCVLMAFAFLWMVLGVPSQEGVWLFSVLIGMSYGSVFTVLPSITSSIWGLQNLARNFGLITYAPFLGTPLFSYLYAFVASAATETRDKEGYSNGVCQGKQCWRSTFLVCAAGGLLAASLSGWLWRSWQGRV